MICTDASIVGKIISPDEGSERLIEAYQEAFRSHESFIAPNLLSYEVVSILNKKKIRKYLTMLEIQAALKYYEGLGIKLLDVSESLDRILFLCDLFGDKLTPYDASYVTLAEKQNAVLWTSDKKLYNLVNDYFPSIRLFE